MLTEEDLQRIDALLVRRVDEAVTRAVEATVPKAVDAAVPKAVDAAVPKAVDAAVAHSIGIFAEDMQHKLGLLAEGQVALGEKLERTEEALRQEIRTVDRRVTLLAADLAAHRADTEAHRGVYGVRES